MHTLQTSQKLSNNSITPTISADTTIYHEETLQTPSSGLTVKSVKEHDTRSADPPFHSVPNSSSSTLRRGGDRFSSSQAARVHRSSNAQQVGIPILGTRKGSGRFSSLSLSNPDGAFLNPNVGPRRSMAGEVGERRPSGGVSNSMNRLRYGCCFTYSRT